MSKFILKFILFLLPLLAIFIVPSLIVLYSREYMTVEDVVAYQSEHKDALFGFVYRGDEYTAYKQKLSESHEPSIIAVGTSRVLQFRDIFFKEPKTFLNMGMAVKNLDDVSLFIDSLPAETSVRTIILGLDPDMLVHADDQATAQRELSSLQIAKELLFINIRKMYIDVVSGTTNISKLIETSSQAPHIGIQALLHKGGFRSDGSYAYNWLFDITDKDIKLKREIFNTISNLDASVYARFKSNDVIVHAVEQKVELIIKKAKEKNIVLIGMITPYPQEIRRYLIADTQYDQATKALPQSMAKIFSEHKMSFFDFSDIALFGGTDQEFVDSIHGTDKMYARMLVFMASRSIPLKQFIDVKALQNMVNREIDVQFHI